MGKLHHLPSLAERLAAARSASILVVDESPEARDDFASSIESRLERSHVITAGSADEARAFLINGRIDVVVCDARPPLEKSLQFLAEVKRRVPGARRVLVADYSDLDAAMGAVKDGKAHKLLLKPLDPDQLVAAILELRR
jgi:two-component system, NtrC family, response regulator HupR/HoxA